MYKINDKEFNTFEEVVKYAWDEHKMESLFKSDEMTEEQKQSACMELGLYLNEVCDECPCDDSDEECT